MADLRQNSGELLAAVEAVERQFNVATTADEAGEQILRLLAKLPESELTLLAATVAAAMREQRRREANGSHRVDDDQDHSHVESQADGNFEHRDDALTMVDSGKEGGPSQEALREQSAILQTILESTTDFVYMKDRQGRYVTINTAAAAFIGRPAAEIIGRPDEELFPFEIAREIQARDQQLFADAVEQRFDETLPSGNRVLHLSTSKNICRDSAGNVIGLVGITRDITAHVEALEALRQSTSLLENIVEHIPLAVFVKDPKDEFSSSPVEQGRRVDIWHPM